MREKTAKKLISEFSKSMPWVSKKPSLKPPLEIVETEEGEIYFFNNKPVFIKSHSQLFPTLCYDDILTQISKVVVNAGAIPFICNGADVMAPGIVQFEGKFGEDDFVIVVDERHRKPLAVTKALYDSEVAESMKRGKVLKNIHYVGDKLWKIMSH
jgi:PUA-domain protein